MRSRHLTVVTLTAALHAAVADGLVQLTPTDSSRNASRPDWRDAVRK